MKGKIKHRIWTLLGEIEVDVSYEIKRLPGGKMVIGNLEISGEKKGDNRPEELDSREVIEEIVNACIEDMQSKKTETVNEILTKEFKTVLPDSDWGAN